MSSFVSELIVIYILMTEGIMVQSMNTDGIKWNKKAKLTRRRFSGHSDTGF